MNIKTLIRSIPHHPKPGVMFRDITTLLKDPLGFSTTIDQLASRYREQRIAKVVGIESRGFIIGAALASQLGAGFVPIRKRGKLPAETVGLDYQLEYGSDRVELHVDAIRRNETVLLVDDLVATGGTAEASCKLLAQAGADLFECCCVVNLPALGGRRRLEQNGVRVFALCEFEGE